MAPPMSPQEIVFWISLFGIDIGVPLMLPEYWRFRVGAIATALSMVGLLWSLGATPVIPTSLGWVAFLVILLVAMTTSIAIKLSGEPKYSGALFDKADEIHDYVQSLVDDERQHGRNLTLLQLDGVRWRRIVSKYSRQHGRQALRLAREAAIPSYQQYAPIFTQPESLKSMSVAAGLLTSFGQLSPQYRMRRVYLAAAQGLLIGAIVFVFVSAILVTRSGTVKVWLFRLAGVCGLALKRPPVSALQHPAIASPKMSGFWR
jgi:hypothetical protein